MKEFTVSECKKEWLNEEKETSLKQFSSCLRRPTGKKIKLAQVKLSIYNTLGHTQVKY